MLVGWITQVRHLISMVDVEIGGQRIDRQYGDWMHIWNQLTLTSEQERGYNKMIGNTTQLTYLTDPNYANTVCSSADVPDVVCALKKSTSRNYSLRSIGILVLAVTPCSSINCSSIPRSQKSTWNCAFGRMFVCL